MAQLATLLSNHSHCIHLGPSISVCLGAHNATKLPALMGQCPSPANDDAPMQSAIPVRPPIRLEAARIPSISFIKSPTRLTALSGASSSTKFLCPICGFADLRICGLSRCADSPSPPQHFLRVKQQPNRHENNHNHDKKKKKKKKYRGKYVRRERDMTGDYRE